MSLNGTRSHHSPLVSYKNAVKKFLTHYLIPLCLLFLFLASIGYLSTLAVLKIEMDSSVDNELKVYWTDENVPFTEQKSTFTATQKGLNTYWFLIEKFGKQTYFRVDPVAQKATIKIHDLTLYSLQHHPLEFNLFNDSMDTKEIEILNQQGISDYHVELISLGYDPQIIIRPVPDRSSLATLILLIFITGLLFRKKQFLYALFILSGLLFIYYLLSFNEASVSFHAQADKMTQVKILWRDKNEQYSNTRIRKVSIKPGSHYYSVDIGNISNIEVIYLEVTNTNSPPTINEITVKELGFKEFVFTKPESIIEKLGEKTTLGISIIIFLSIYTLGTWAVYPFAQKKRLFYGTFFPKIMYASFFMALLLMFNLAWQSNVNIHPDEHAHIESIKYYSEYWMPPKVGDARAISAYQAPWAISRLDDLGISYFFAGKIRSVIQTLFVDDTFVARAFNLLLFCLLFIFSRKKRFLLFLVPLLCSPQIWYLFSYANRGGFVLFISLLLAWQLVNQKSYLNHFLSGKKAFTQWKSILFPSLLLGLLTIEQTNYILFILFVFSVLLWRLLFFVIDKKTFFYKCLIFMLVGISVFLCRYTFDVSINGFDRQEQRIAYANEHAGAEFKPSIATTKESYSGLRLKAKGVSFSELFDPEWDWHKMTFKSFTGFYGYYAEYSPRWYYAYILLVYGVVFLVFLKHALVKENWRYNLFSALSLIAIFGGLLMGLLFSWLHDFQPQGRYVFPIIPIMLVYFWTLFPRLGQMEKSILLTSIIILILLSFYSFNEVALNYLVS